MPDGSEVMIPDVEMVHLMINSRDGLHGRGVLQYARETLGRQANAHETQDDISGSKLNPTAALWVNGEIDKPARDVVKKAYLDAIEGGAVIFDTKIAKFETITMKPSDAQFLETVNATDQEIANFFGIPAYKLGMGKQSYESNEQQNLEYLKSSLNPFLIQWEQAGNLKWFAEVDQPFNYLKFNRDALLQTDAKTRAEVMKLKIESGQLSPNEALGIDDQNGYPGGDAHYIMGNMARIKTDGSLEMGGAAQPAQGGK
jgi:HK97 family phage portal protein